MPIPATWLIEKDQLLPVIDGVQLRVEQQIAICTEQNERIDVRELNDCVLRKRAYRTEYACEANMISWWTRNKNHQTNAF